MVASTPSLEATSIVSYSRGQFNNESNDSADIIPEAVISEVFSHLNLSELGVSTQQNIRGKTCSPFLEMAAIYRQIAVSSMNRAQRNGNIVNKVLPGKNISRGQFGNKSKDSAEIIPNAVISEIFSYFNLHENLW